MQIWKSNYEKLKKIFFFLNNYFLTFFINKIQNKDEFRVTNKWTLKTNKLIRKREIINRELK